MKKEKDYYKILGINHDSDKREIKKAYRQLARKFHPDINPGNRLYEEKFKELGEAYSILIDDNKRLQYNNLRGITNLKPHPEQVKRQASKAYSTNKTKSSTEKHRKFGFKNNLKDFITTIIIDGI